MPQTGTVLLRRKGFRYVAIDPNRQETGRFTGFRIHCGDIMGTDGAEKRNQRSSLIADPAAAAARHCKDEI
jgi:hypothetical protein